MTSDTDQLAPGDEYDGIAAIPQVYREIEPRQLCGRLVMAPVCNMPAYEAAQRSSPIDGLNLARVFPGDVFYRCFTGSR